MSEPQTFTESQEVIEDSQDYLHKPLVHIDEDALEKEIIVYRASGLGACINALVYARLEFEPEAPPDWLLQRYNESAGMELTAFNRFLKDYLTEGDDYSLHTQPEYHWEVFPGIFIIGHADGEASIWKDLTNTSEHFILEIKVVGDAFYKKFTNGVDKIPEVYKWQISCYMLARKLPLKLFVLPKDDKSGLPLTFHFDTPPISQEEIEAKISDVESLAESGVPTECDGKAMWPCPYWKHHIKPEVESVESPDELNSTIGEWKTTKEAEQKAKAEYEAIKLDRQNLEREIITYLEGSGDVDVITGAGITLKRVKSKNTYPDWKLMEKHGLDPDVYKKQTHYSYLKELKGD